MKRVLLTVLLFWVTLGYGQDVRFISDNTGNDSNSGVDFANAWLTLGMAVSDGQAAGDTVVCVGTFTEELQPTADGTDGNPIVWIDSLRYVDGFNATQPDTFWTAIIDGETYCVQTNDDDWYDFIGFNMTSASSRLVFTSTISNGNKFYQVKFSGHDGSSWHILLTSTDNDLYSCLILDDGSSNFGLSLESNYSGNIYNNTFRGSFSTTIIQFTDGIGTDDCNFKNNIIDATSGGDIDLRANFRDNINSFDNNIYNGTATNLWDFNSTAFNLIATWEDSVNNHDVDGAASSLGTDPVLQATATTAYILNTSPAAEAGEDLGRGNDIGYYQTDPVSSATPATKPKGKPFIFGENYISNDGLYVSLDY